MSRSFQTYPRPTPESAADSSRVAASFWQVQLNREIEDQPGNLLQAMCNRRAFGSVRYAETHPEGTTPVRDHAHSAELSLMAAAEPGAEERFIDAAVYAFLAWRRSEKSGPLADSPGVVQDGKVRYARGRWAHWNQRWFRPGQIVTPR